MACGSTCAAACDVMPRRLFPPDDIGEWMAVPVPVAWSDAFKDNDITDWLRRNVKGGWYVRDNYITIRGFEALQKIYSFEDHGEGMAFAMRWT